MCVIFFHLIRKLNLASLKGKKIFLQGHSGLNIIWGNYYNDFVYFKCLNYQIQHTVYSIDLFINTHVTQFDIHINWDQKVTFHPSLFTVRVMHVLKTFIFILKIILRTLFKNLWS